MALTYDEITVKWDNIARQRDNKGPGARVVSSSAPAPAASVAPSRETPISASKLDKMVDRSISRALHKRGPSPVVTSQGQQKKQKKEQWCNQFNQPQGCRGQKTATGCVTKNGQHYKHGCSVRLAGTNDMCNALDHSAMNHKE